MARALARHRRALVGAFLAALGVALATVGLAGTSAWLIVRAAEKPAVLSLSVPMGLVQLFALGKAAGRYLERTVTHDAVLSVMAEVRHDVARLIEPLAPAGLGPRSAEVVDLAVRDVESVEDLLASVAGPLAAAVASALVTALVCGLVVGPSAAVLIGALLVELALVPWLVQRPLSRADERLQMARERLSALSAEAAAGWEEYALGGAPTALAQRLESLEADYDAAEAARRRARALVEGLLLCVGGLSTMAVLSLTSAARAGGLNRALVAVPALLAMGALDLLGAAVSGLSDSGAQRAALGRFDSLATRSRPVTDPSEPDASPASDEPLALEGVAHAFERAVLVDVHLHARVGELIVLRGPSGSGKSTLGHVIARLLSAQAGHTSLAGVDYARLSGTQVRERVGFSEASAYVFAGSLRANLRLARAGASDDELLEALNEAGLADWLAGLEHGLDTPLGGVRSGLSGGEQRRLGLARAYLSARRVLVLDEPTEGLDEATARDVLDRLATRQRDALTVLISHRERDDAVATRVLALVGGRLVNQARAPS